MLLLAGCTGVLDMFGRAAGPPATVCVPSICACDMPGAVAAAERRLQVRLSSACVQEKVCSYYQQLPIATAMRFASELHHMLAPQ